MGTNAGTITDSLELPPEHLLASADTSTDAALARLSWQRIVVWVGNVTIALWGVRWLRGPELSPGADVTGNLQRIEFAWGLFRHGQIDGWFPGAMLGYQLHLFYGPGLAVAAGIVRLLSFGTISSAGALQFVLVAALVAVPWAVARLGRALGLRWWTAAAAGVFGLAISSPRGGGIAGGFETALAAQQVAVPLVILAMALAIECLDLDRKGSPLSLAITITVLALTHPLSLVVLGLLGPVLLVAAWGLGRVAFRQIPRLAVAAAWTTGLAACWWLPAMAHRDLRGPATSWDQPSVFEHLDLLISGERGFAGPFGRFAVLSIVAAVVVGTWFRRRDLIVLGLLPVAALTVLHLTHGALGTTDPLGMQLPNRGLIYAALLAAPVSARILESVWPTRWSIVVWVSAAAIVAVSIHGLEPPTWATQQPTTELRETAAALDAEVPDGGRFAFVRGPFHLGVPAPERWLAWASGRPGLAPFGPEYAPGSGAAMAAPNAPPSGELTGWTDGLRTLAVSHIVVVDPDLNARMQTDSGVAPVFIGPSLTVWSLHPSPRHPVGSVVPSDGARVISSDPDSHLIDVSSESARPNTSLALGWSPGWRAWIDEIEIPTAESPGGRLSIDLPSGSHVIRLQFDEPRTGRVGRAITALTVLLAVGTRKNLRIRWNRSPHRGLEPT